MDADADLWISSQIDLFDTFLQVISFLQVKLVSQKDNYRKSRSYLSRNSNKIKTSNVQNFFVFG